MSGLDHYLDKFPNFQVADLYQDPLARPRHGSKCLPALTTGCARLWLRKQKRFCSGIELLLMHSVPVTKQAAELMCCDQIQLGQLSHRSMCRLAGNSMHGGCVGMVAAIVMRCVSTVHQ